MFVLSFRQADKILANLKLLNDMSTHFMGIVNNSNALWLVHAMHTERSRRTLSLHFGVLDFYYRPQFVIAVDFAR